MELYAGEGKTVYVAEAGHSDSADTATRATQDGNGVNIAQSYLRTMGDASNTTAQFNPNDESSALDPVSGGTLWSTFGRIVRRLRDIVSGAVPVAKATSADTATQAAQAANADTVDGKHASDFIPASAKGAASGVASLDESGRVPAAQLPSYVDDVLEYATVSAFPAQGEAGKIYVATQTNLTYRWSGTGYVEISPSLALGGTSSTAFPGDRGVTLETKMSNILDGGLKVAKATSADTAAQANHATSADSATQATNADYANAATNASYAVHAQQADKAASDADGNKISDTYLKRSGGTMTGTLVQKKGNCAIHTDVASYRIPSQHKGWIALDCGINNAISIVGYITLYRYYTGALSIQVSGYTYAEGIALTRDNWIAPRYGIYGSWYGDMPRVVFVKDKTTGRRYIIIGGDEFEWNTYDYVSLDKVVLGSLGNTTAALPFTWSALSGTVASLGLVAATAGDMSQGVEVQRARQDKEGNDIPSTYATKEELPDVYVDTVPTNPKDGDILITTTD